MAARKELTEGTDRRKLQEVFKVENIGKGVYGAISWQQGNCRVP